MGDLSDPAAYAGGAAAGVAIVLVVFVTLFVIRKVRRSREAKAAAGESAASVPNPNPVAASPEVVVQQEPRQGADSADAAMQDVEDDADVNHSDHEGETERSNSTRGSQPVGMWWRRKESSGKPIWRP